jgi:hypothetical protein
MSLLEFRIKGLPADLEDRPEQQRQDRDRHPRSKGARSLLSGAKGAVLLAVAAVIVVPMVSPTVSKSPAVPEVDLQCSGQIRTAFDLVGTIYQLPDSTIQLPNFKTLAASKSVHVHDVEIPAEVNGIYPYGIVYRGSFWISGTGTYIFRVTSDDGSKLFIDDRLVINNDGSHGANLVRQGVRLTGGRHTLRLEFFECCGGGAYLTADMCAAKPK